MRVTDSMIVKNNLTAIRTNTSKVATSQQKISLGKKFVRPSDAPNALKESLHLRENLRQQDSFLYNVDKAHNTLTATEVSLRDTISQLTEVRVSTISASSPASNFETRDAASIAVDQILEKIVSLSNSKDGNSPVFSGTVNSNAYDVVRDVNGQITAVNYLGNNAIKKLEIGPGGEKIATNVPGNQIFDDVFQTLIDVRDTLGNKAGLSSANQLTQINSALADIDNVFNQTQNQLVEVGSRLKHLEDSNETLQDIKLQYQIQQSKVEDVDLAEESTKLLFADNTLKSTLFVTSQNMNSGSLLDFIS